VLTQFTGPPELDTADEPSGPHGMPIAGRVSNPFGGFGDVVDAGGVCCGTVLRGAVVCCTVVGGTVVFGTVVWAGVGAVVVTLGTSLVVVGNVVTGAGVVATGCGPITGGRGGPGGPTNAGSAVVVGSDEVGSTLVGVSLD
jgi:hypothetical protein